MRLGIFKVKRSEETGLKCQAKGCGKVDRRGMWGPPLMSPRSRWYCEAHGNAAWRRWMIRRRRARAKGAAKGEVSVVSE